MSTIKETERLDKLVEGLDTIGLTKVEENNQPEKYKEWTETIDDMSDKKFQKEYVQHAFNKSKKEIRPNTSVIFLLTVRA